MFRFTRVLQSPPVPTQAPSGAASVPWTPAPAQALKPVLSRSSQPGGPLRTKKKARVVVDETHNEVLAFDNALPPSSLRTHAESTHRPPAPAGHAVGAERESIKKRSALKHWMGRLARGKQVPEPRSIDAAPPPFIYDHEFDMLAAARRARGPQVSIWHRTVVWPSGVIFRASKGYRATAVPEGVVIFPDGRVSAATVSDNTVHFFYDVAREEPMLMRLGPKARHWDDAPGPAEATAQMQPIAIPVAPYSPARAKLLEKLEPQKG